MQIDRALAFLSIPPRLKYATTSGEETIRWADQIRTTVRRHLDPAQVQPLIVKNSTWCVRNNLRVEDYEFEVSGRGSFHGTLILPESGTQHPAILVCPGRNASLAAVTGATPPDYPDRNVAEQLANMGFAALTLDYGIQGGFDAATVNGRDEVTMLGLALELAGHSLLALLVQDALCGLAWMAQHPALDAVKLGIFGHSLGAHIALHAALAHPDPLPVGLASFMGFYQSIFARHGTGGSAHALPGIYRLADLPDLVAALVPAPLQIQIGTADPFVPSEEAKRAADTAVQSYTNLHSKANLEVHVSSMGHGTDIAAMARFFERRFKSSAIVPKPRMRVPAAKIHFDLNARKEIVERIDESLATGSLTLGRYGLQFESLAQQWTGSPHVVALNSGTSALEVALRIINVKNGTVLIPANTFFATALAAIHAGASVRFVDIELDGLGMDPDQLRRELDRCPDAAAVVVVHMGGIVAPSVHEVLEICRVRGLPLIEDAAHALGSTLNGVFAGSIGEMASFSMYPTKIATSGEGGFLTCSSAQSATTARLLRDQGKDSFEANIHSRLGYNWRMSELHASVGIAHLERLGQFLYERRGYAAVYDALLEEVPGVLSFPVPHPAVSNYYKYIAMLPENIDRDALKARIRTQGIQLSGEVYQIPCCAQPYFANAFPQSQFPRAYEFCRRHICLPVFSTMTEEQQRICIEGLKTEVTAMSAVSAIA